MASMTIDGKLYHRRGIHGQPKKEAMKSAAYFRRAGHYARVITRMRGQHDVYVSARKRSEY